MKGNLVDNSQQTYHNGKYNSSPQVNTGWRDLLNAIVLRTVQDYLLDHLAIPGSLRTTGSKEKIKKEAEKFIISDDFEWICYCAGKDYAAIRKTLIRKV